MAIEETNNPIIQNMVLKQITKEELIRQKMIPPDNFIKHSNGRVVAIYRKQHKNRNKYANRGDK
jgi:hypothetical protein